MGGQKHIPRWDELHGANLQVKVSTAKLSTWPEEMHGELAWDSTSFPDEQDHTWILDENEKAEIRAALRHFNSMVSSPPSLMFVSLTIG
jgi:hypothetical protein